MSSEAPKTKAYLRAMRNRGYADGLAGKPRAFDDADYRRSWRRGSDKRKELGLDN